MTVPVLGIDPGGADTGIILRHGPTLLRAVTVTRGATSDRPTYVTQVVDAIADIGFRVEWRTDNPYLASEASPLAVLVAVEDVIPPSGHAANRAGHIINPAGIIDTAVTFGAILGRWPDAVVVPPGGNGSAPMGAYPAELRPTRGHGAGRDRLRHLRSAWDVADIAPRLARRATLAP